MRISHDEPNSIAEKPKTVIISKPADNMAIPYMIFAALLCFLLLSRKQSIAKKIHPKLRQNINMKAIFNMIQDYQILNHESLQLIVTRYLIKCEVCLQCA